jgi:hypothetical protein
VVREPKLAGDMEPTVVIRYPIAIILDLLLLRGIDRIVRMSDVGAPSLAGSYACGIDASQVQRDSSQESLDALHQMLFGCWLVIAVIAALSGLAQESWMPLRLVVSLTIGVALTNAFLHQLYITYPTAIWMRRHPIFRNSLFISTLLAVTAVFFVFVYA